MRERERERERKRERERLLFQNSLLQGKKSKFVRDISIKLLPNFKFKLKPNSLKDF